MNIKEYYNKRFRNQFNKWVRKTNAHEHLGEGIYISHRDLCIEKLSHVPNKDIPLFFCSLGWSVLIDQVMYTYFKKDYPKFQAMTLYPKIEIGIKGINISPGWIFGDYLTKETIDFFLMDLKKFFYKNEFEEASWKTVIKVMLGDKDIDDIIKKEIIRAKRIAKKNYWKM